MTTKEYLEICHKKDCLTNKECLDSIKGFNKEIVSKYPWLHPTNRWSGKKDEDYAYVYTELDAMPDGWRLAFGDDMIEEIHQELVKYDFVDSYRILQIKEKYGYLRWYDNGTPIGKLSDSYVGITLKANETKLMYPQFGSPQYCWLDETTEHYISPFSEEAKAYSKEELEEYNSRAIRHYKVYEVLEKCLIPDIIAKYERLSAKTCIACGKPAIWESVGYISPYCDTCAKDMFKKLKGENMVFEDMFSSISEEDD